MGGFNGTTADHESLFAVEVIAGAVAVVVQILQQLVFTCLFQLPKGLYRLFNSLLPAGKKVVFLLLQPVLALRGCLAAAASFSFR